MQILYFVCYDAQSMKTKDVITLLGGTSKIGKAMGISSQAVSLWIRTNSIPLRRIPSLERLAKQKGLPIRAEDMRPDIDWAALREGSLRT